MNWNSAWPPMQCSRTSDGCLADVSQVMFSFGRISMCDLQDIGEAMHCQLQMVGGARLSAEQRDVILAVRDAFLRSVGALMARRRHLVSTIQVRSPAAMLQICAKPMLRIRSTPDISALLRGVASWRPPSSCAPAPLPPCCTRQRACRLGSSYCCLTA